MNQRKLGRTDLLVSEYCLDAATLGWHPAADDAGTVLDAFLEAGGTFIQLQADSGEDASESGVGALSETLVGRWLHSRRIARPEVMLSYCIHLPSISSYFRLAAEIRSSCERALRRLGTTYLDLLLIRWTDGLPVDDTLVAVEYLQRSGMFRHLGGVGFPAWRAMEWIGHADRRRLSRLETLQTELAPPGNTGSWQELRELALHQRLGLVVRPPYTTPTDNEHPRGVLRPYPVLNPNSCAIAQIARERGLPPRQVALAWALADPSVSSVLVAADTPADVEDLRRAARIELAFHELLQVGRGAPPVAAPGFREPNGHELRSTLQSTPTHSAS
jgi:aryl-alcohol dehydrogenase-like predicted oxidoreductase